MGKEDTGSDVTYMEFHVDCIVRMIMVVKYVEPKLLDSERKCVMKLAEAVTIYNKSSIKRLYPTSRL